MYDICSNLGYIFSEEITAAVSSAIHKTFFPAAGTATAAALQKRGAKLGAPTTERGKTHTYIYIGACDFPIV